MLKLNIILLFYLCVIATAYNATEETSTIPTEKTTNSSSTTPASTSTSPPSTTVTPESIKANTETHTNENTTISQTNSVTDSSPSTVKKIVNVTISAANQLPPPLRNLMAKFAESENVYGHVEVRKGAFLFWWLYYADGTKVEAHNRPLVIWLQGGPSIPGSGMGNFVEIGPLTVTLKKRPYSWVNGKNVLFVDSPVQSGYSYVENVDQLCKTDKDVAADLIQLMKTLLVKFPEFATTPTHIFSQSYGTKIAAYFAYYLNKDIESGELKMNLQTIALGGSWIDTRASTLQTVEFLYQTGFLDQREVAELRGQINNLTGMIDRKEYREAFKYRLEVYSRDRNFDGYNVFKPYSDRLTNQLTQLMNGLLPLYLGPEYRKNPWRYLSTDVINALSAEFMKPAVHVVEKILSETNLRVVVYNGDLDSVTPIAGAVNWVHGLNWTGREAFWNATRQPLNGIMNGYFKEHDKLSFWWILKAGHWVPTDNPEAMDQLLQYIVHEKKDIFSTPTEY